MKKVNNFSAFIKKYSSDDFLRLHTPGHQGRCHFINSLSSLDDITEISGSDSLYHSSGIIKDLEDEISRLYQARSVISAGGSTLCIQTMLALFRGKKFVAMRSSHISFYNTCALLGISPIWIGPSFLGFPCKNQLAKELENALISVCEPSVVYITSPNYCGINVNISKISQICKKYNAILMVDNAHGAHLKFTTQDTHPISLGADICCDSFHKTLPTLTGAAVLHFRPDLVDKREVKHIMSIFGSTSPSYMIMNSIALCVDWLKSEAKLKFQKLQKKKDSVVKNLNVNVLKTDCSKLTIDAQNIKNGAKDVAKLLRSHKIEPEYVGSRYLTMVLSPFLSKADWNRIENCLKKIQINLNNSYIEGAHFPQPKVKISLKQAFWSKSERVEIKKSAGRIASKCQWICPPGVPIVAAGELITPEIVELLMKNKMKYIDVVKNI